MVGDAAGLDAKRPALLELGVELPGLDLECDVEIEVVLRLELERPAGRLEERHARAVAHLEEGMQDVGRSPRLRLPDFESLHERKPQEVLVEAAGLLGIPATEGRVMKTLYGRPGRVTLRGHAACFFHVVDLPFRRQRADMLSPRSVQCNLDDSHAPTLLQ